ncbi:isoprenoid synthase domain-containing protein [Xylaria flabelliformis]|nr:isoprenoid synthase domain-containing protein [Xylaria flabelliformis]
MGKNGQAESMPCNEAIPYGCSREELVTSIRGTEVVIPDFQSLLSHWPAKVHEEVGRLSEDVQRRLESIFTSAEDKSRIQWLTACNLDLFGASWWPCASFENLVITTALAVWLFAWDDETDSLEFSPLLNDFEKACKFRKDTIRYLEAALSLSPDPNVLNNASNDRLITNFLPVGQAIARSYDDRQLNAFLRELRFFVEMNEEEQQHQMTAALPSVEDYIRRREGTSATRVCLALHEYAIDLRLPAVIMESMEMQAIWHESNMIISTLKVLTSNRTRMNDVLSLKKEVDQSQVDTLIPLLSVRLGSVQAAISKATEMLHNNIQVYIDSCKYACTANLNWSLKSKFEEYTELKCDYKLRTRT